MQTRTWVRSVRDLIRRGKFPTKRRRAKLEANRQFEQVLSGLGPGDVAIDCGANIGKFTAMMAATGATVYAFEPDPHAFGLLRERIGQMTNVTAFNQAVGAENDVVMLYRRHDYDANPRRSSASSSVFATKDNVDKQNCIAVDQIDLLSFIKKCGHPVLLLKLDVEGAEVPIIEKMIESGLVHIVKHIFVETHEKRIPEIAERTAILREFLSKQSLLNFNLDWR